MTKDCFKCLNCGETMKVKQNCPFCYSSAKNVVSLPSGEGEHHNIKENTPMKSSVKTPVKAGKKVEKVEQKNTVKKVDPVKTVNTAAAKAGVKIKTPAGKVTITRKNGSTTTIAKPTYKKAPQIDSTGKKNGVKAKTPKPAQKPTESHGDAKKAVSNPDFNPRVVDKNGKELSAKEGVKALNKAVDKLKVTNSEQKNDAPTPIPASAKRGAKVVKEVVACICHKCKWNLFKCPKVPCAAGVECKAPECDKSAETKNKACSERAKELKSAGFIVK